MQPHTLERRPRLICLGHYIYSVGDKSMCFANSDVKNDLGGLLVPERSKRPRVSGSIGESRSANIESGFARKGGVAVE
jgi:hypothetical protein